MPDISELLLHYNINIPSHNPGRYTTTCPWCSASRKKNHQRNKVLGVTITADGRIYFGCNHCHITGPTRGVRDELPHYDYGLDARKTKANGKFTWEHRNGAGDWVNGSGGSISKLYRIDEAIEAGGTILVAEGEKDVDNLWTIGFPAVCHPHGAGNWTAEHSTQLAGRSIVVLNDNDEPGYKYATSVVKHSLGVAASVRRLDLKDYWPEIGPGQDVSDWLEIGGGSEEWLERIIDELPEINGEDARGEPPQAPASHLIALQSIGDDFNLEMNDFVEGLLVENSLIVIYGDSSTGKSFWAVDLGLHVAASAEWNNRLTDQGGVIYVALEGGRSVRNRVNAAAHHLKFTPDIPFRYAPCTLDLRSNANDATRLINTVAKLTAELPAGVPVKLIIIDTMSRALNGGKEDSEDMGALLANADRIRLMTGAAVLFVAHCGKDQARGIRGWSGVRAAIDTEIEITRNETIPPYTARVTKQRDLVDGTSFSFSLKVVELGTNRRGTQVTTCVVEPAESSGKRKTSGRRMTDAQLRLQRHIADAIASCGIDITPVPGMGVYKAVPREELRLLLVSKAWFSEGVLEEVSKAGFSKADKVSKAGLTAENNGLTALENRGFIGFNRNFVWLTP